MRPRSAAFLIGLVLAGALTLPPASHAQEPPRYLNLDFESPGFPHDWYTGSEGYSVDLDSIAPYSGRQCLRIRYLSPGRVGVATQSIPVEAVAGRRLHLAGYVRTEGITTGWAALWCRIDGANRMLTQGTARSPGARGTTPWTRQVLDIPVDSTATHIDVGAILTGDGIAWFDRLEISIDGAPYPQPPAPTLFDPSDADLGRLRGQAASIATDDPEQPCDDLLPVLRMVGNARLVGLGEGTHGTREFSRIKHRLLRCLVEDLGFTLFAVEANEPEAARLNHYILTGEGDPVTLLRAMHFWPWNTEEVLDLVRWMRAYDASGRGPLQLLGFDMQYPALAMDSLAKFVRRADPGYGPALAESLSRIALTRATDGRGSAGGASATLNAAPFAGRRLRVQGFIRTEEVEPGYAGLWIRAEGDSGVLAQDTMSDRRVTGTTGWRACSAALTVPERARRISFGALLAGSGTAWFDSLALDVQGRRPATADRLDLDFEGRPALGGLHPVGPIYRVSVDTTTARSGRRSLRVAEDPVAATALRIQRWTRAADAAREVLRHLEADSNAMAARASSPADIARAFDDARLILQSCEAMRNPSSRDRSMAENAMRFLDRAPGGSKMVLWAHNAHVSRREGAMGSFLAERYGAGYLPIGLALHDGHYLAGEGRHLEAHEAMPSQPGSLEWALHRTGLPRFALDLRQAAPTDSSAAWLSEEMEFRNIGALPVQHGFYRMRVAHDFDVLLFFDHTTPSRPLL